MDTENTSSSDIKAQDLALVSTAESVLDCAVIDKDASKLLGQFPNYIAFESGILLKLYRNGL